MTAKGMEGNMQQFLLAESQAEEFDNEKRLASNEKGSNSFGVSSLKCGPSLSNNMKLRLQSKNRRESFDDSEMSKSEEPDIRIKVDERESVLIHKYTGTLIHNQPVEISGFNSSNNSKPMSLKHSM